MVSQVALSYIPSTLLASLRSESCTMSRYSRTPSFLNNLIAERKNIPVVLFGFLLGYIQDTAVAPPNNIIRGFGHLLYFS